MLLSISNLSKSFGADLVLDGLTFRLAAREKVALVGRNGTGKTTLLRIIAGEEEPDSGGVSFARGTRLGYLSQISPVPKGQTVYEAAQQSIERRTHLAKRLRELEKMFQTGNATAEDVEEFNLVHEHFLESEGYAIERDTEVVLAKLGFEKEQFAKQTDVLSGGERTRLALARLLLDQPELLILDEPTNHLDLEATSWLESWVNGYHGAVIIVSHDRRFLEATAERFLLLRAGKIEEYAGPFAKYQKLRAEAEERQAKIAKKQAKEIENLDEFVRRFMNSQRTAQARGRLKMMNRLIDSKIEAPQKEKSLSGSIKPPKRSGEIVMQLKMASKSFGDNALFRDLSWTINRLDRWGVVGDNGGGKTTLIRCCLGLEPLDSGEVRLGSSLQIGYFSQDSDDLDPNQSPLEAVVELVGDNIQAARNLLARFLITGEDAFRPISTFSGGERNKISLARLVALRPNVLVLDEPTNHLDMDSRNALSELLIDYKGTLLLISHDRWLLGRCTNRTLELKRNRVTAYSGSFEEVQATRVRESAPGKPMPAPTQAERLSQREISKSIQKIAKLVEEIEAAALRAEQKLKQIEKQLESPAQSDLPRLLKEHADQKQACDEILAKWAEHMSELEELKSRQGSG